MAVEFDLSLRDHQNSAIHFDVKVRLNDDYTWRMVNPANTAIRKVYQLPLWGRWDVWGVTPLPGPTTPLRGALRMFVPATVGVGIFLGEFFPATIGKTGKGTGTGGQAEVMPYSDATWCITLAENFLTAGFPEKFRKAVELAKKKFSAKLPPALLNALLDPVFIGLIALHFVKSPAMWFQVLKKAGGALLALFSLVQFAYRFNDVLIDIDTALSDAELAAAGDKLAETMADLAAMIGITAVLAMVEIIRQSKGTDEPKSEQRGPLEQKLSEPPRNYRSWRDGCNDLEARLRRLQTELDTCDDPDACAAKAQRIMALRTLLAFWRRFMIETAHHIEWLQKAGAEMQTMAVQVRKIIDANGGRTGGGYEQALHWMQAQMRNAGIPFDDLPVGRWAEVIRALDVCGDIDWSAHDMESWLTTKFNEAVSQGLKNPFNFRELPEMKGWKLPQFAKGAAGLDPRPGQNGPLTADVALKLLGPKAAEFLKIYGSPKAIFRGLVDAEEGYQQHNQNLPKNGRLAPGHHQPGAGLEKISGDDLSRTEQARGGVKIFDRAHGAQTNFSHNALWLSALLEKGCDDAHACLQLRLYRVFFGKKPFTTATIVEEFGTNPWVRVGLLVFSKFDMSKVVDPATVSPDALKRFGMPDLILEARSMNAKSATGR